jgi:protein-tyrosine phosphatase
MAEPGALIALRTLPNLRDVGGYATRDGGTVRTGVLFRSTELGRLEGEDVEAVAALGLRTVFDLRTEAERETTPDRLPEGVQLVVCDVLADSSTASAADLPRLLADPQLAKAALGAGRTAEMFDTAYRDIVSKPSALAAYRRMFTTLIDADDAHPALFHCTTGKDRTGWAAAALLSLLGVADADVLADYLLTNTYLLPALQPYFDGFEAAGGDPALLRPVLGVQAGYLATAQREMRDRFVTVDGYFADGLGIDADGQDRLRELLVAR